MKNQSSGKYLCSFVRRHIPSVHTDESNRSIKFGFRSVVSGYADEF